LKGELEKPTAIPSKIIRPYFEFEVALFRIQKRKELWIWQEDIDIVTDSIADAKHHCGATSERPTLDDRVGQVCLSND
jgi:hypothetical protein